MSKWKSHNLLNLTPDSFIRFAVKIGIFNMKQLNSLEISYSNMDLIQFFKILLNKDFIREEQITEVMEFIIADWRMPILKYDINDNKFYELYDEQKKPFTFDKTLNWFVRPFFFEWIEEYWFKEQLISLYDIDNQRKIISFFMVAPTNKWYTLIKNFKAKSKRLREKQKVIYEEEIEYEDIDEITWKKTIKKKIEKKVHETSFEEYKFKIIIAPYSIVNKIFAYNSSLTESMSIATNKMDKELKQQWISLTDEDDGIYRIEEWLDTSNSNIDALIYKILNKQFEDDVSDIHIEPLLDSTDPKLWNAWFIRYRIDWDLQWRETSIKIGEDWEPYVEMVPVIKWKYNEILGQLKEKSGISTSAEAKNLPWDWKLKVYIVDRDTLLEYRVSTMPEWVAWQWGKDKMVLRKLERGAAKLDLEKMNMDKDKKLILDSFVWTRDTAWRFNNWLILMTWPTWSWKSTTLFSILNQINKPELNIQTLEDPIEYVVPWINQSQIWDASTNDTETDSYTYAKGMRACLRQDPDILLIWEIRDEITMDISKEAAATWHLVFSSLHTNDTWQTLDRLEWLKFDLKLVWNIVRLIMAQRLWKVVCNQCRKEYNDPALSYWDHEVQIQREQEYLEMKMDIVRKLLDSPYVSKLPNNIEDIKLYEWEWLNCAECWWKKTKWRLWIYEFLPTSSVNIAKFIKEHWTSVDNERVKKELYIPEWITTLQQNALLKTFSPNISYKWEPMYMSYHDALGGAWADPYEWDRDYKNIWLKELNLLLKQRKIERKVKENDDKLKIMETQISSEEKLINNFNKEEKEKLINKLKEEEKTILKENEEYYKVLDSLWFKKN